MLAQGGIPLCDAVLQGVDGGVLQQLLGNLPHRLIGEGVRGGVARGQGMTLGSEEFFKISRMAEGLRLFTRSEN